MSRRQASSRTKNEELGPSSRNEEEFTSRSAFENILDSKLESLKQDLASKEHVKELLGVIKDQQSKINILESRVVLLEKYVSHLEKTMDDQEQYQCRLCLRVNNVEIKLGETETAGDCLEKVKEMFNELSVKIPDSAIDRAHRIGKVKEKDGKRYRQVIIQFTTWRHRTMVYKARKNSDKYRIRLDLTKKRIKVIEKTNDMLRSRKLTGFTFADVNCRLCAKLDDGFHYFEDDKEFEDLINQAFCGEENEGTEMDE
eukprot:gene2001-2276_t